MKIDLWQHCLDRLQNEIPNQQFNTWIRPLHCVQEDERLRLMAPNAFVLDWVKKHYLERLKGYLKDLGQDEQTAISLEIGSAPRNNTSQAHRPGSAQAQDNQPKRQVSGTIKESAAETIEANTNPGFNFDSFVEGKSNQLARAAGMQIGDNPGRVYNPLFIYGGVGLGKTHLMHAVGNRMLQNNPQAQVLYMHSEGFVAEMVKALQHGTIDNFKRKMRSVNALLIDDVQFFAGKERSQEEFFHTFNALFESQQQIILTSDRFPKEVDGLEDRLKSRFGWGLTVAVEPPDLETRVAILQSKAQQLFGVELPNEVAFFIGKRVR
jgi:chromosomal replication initiator protein